VFRPDIKVRRDQVSIPEPYENLASLRSSAIATKELVEVLAGQRGQAYTAAVTWGDLVRIGLIKEDQIPRDVGSRPF
jgi:hypothetical protein